MRILVLSNLFPPDFIGGYELMASEVAAGFAAHGHEVLVATAPLVSTLKAEMNWSFDVKRNLRNAFLSNDPETGNELTNRGVFVDIQNLQSINSVLIDFKPDAVYCMNIYGLGSIGIVWFLIASGYTPIVHLGDNVFSYGSENQGRFTRLRSYFGLDSFVDRVSWIAVSKTVLRETSASLCVNIPTATFIPAWVYYRPAIAADIEEDSDTNVAKFIFASRVAPHKGIHIILEAVKELLERGEKRFRVDVYGGGEVAEWTQRSSSQHLDTNLFFKGTVSKQEMLRTYQQYDALLLPTWERDPCPTVVGEAAAAGCIPIFTQNAGVSEWFLDGHDCIKTPRNSHSLMCAMLNIMTMDRAARRKQSKRISAYARRFFYFDNWYPKFERIAWNSRRQVPLDAASQNQVFAASCAIARLWKG